GGTKAQQARVSRVTPVPADGLYSYSKTVITDPGQGYASAPAGYFVSSDKKKIPLNITLDGNRLNTADPQNPNDLSPELKNYTLLGPAEVVFTGGGPDGNDPKKMARAVVYPAVTVESVILEGEAVAGYEDDLEVSFSGGDVGPLDFVMPAFDIGFKNGKAV